jgi:hypothetical protein
MPLITGAQVRQHTPQISGTLEDSNFETVVNRADALMAAYCRWPKTNAGIYTMVSSTYVLYPRPWHEDPRALGYDLRWVATITSAYIDALWEYGADTQVTASDLVVDNDEGVLWLKPNATSFSAWSTERRANKVTLTAGFAATPDEIVVACAFAVRHLLGRGRTGGNVASRAGESVTPADADTLLPKATKEALGAYMRSSALVA